MSKNQKKESEIKHRMVHDFLVKNFPCCEVKYDGVEGLDHQIIFNGHTTWLETKSCKKIILAGLDKKRMKENDEPRIFNHLKLGQFKFDQRNVYPYSQNQEDNGSQHQNLIDLNGWYVFVVGHRIIAGIPAKKLDEIQIGGTWEMKRVVWAHILRHCHPDWLKYLKMQVYEII